MNDDDVLKQPFVEPPKNCPVCGAPAHAQYHLLVSKHLYIIGTSFRCKATWMSTGGWMHDCSLPIDRVTELETALKTLLASRACLPGGQVDIPEQISASFDIGLGDAQQITDAMARTTWKRFWLKYHPEQVVG